MEAKIIFKLCYIICLIFFSNMVFAQDKIPKYLLFNGSKDSVIEKNNIRYYKIDGNLFDTNRYQEIDTVNLKVFNKITIISVNKLGKEANAIIDNYIRKEKKEKTGVIQIIDKYNRLFTHIYILDKISDNFYNDLAWEGLQNTVAWNELSSNEKTRIINAINDYKNNGNKNCN